MRGDCIVFTTLQTCENKARRRDGFYFWDTTLLKHGFVLALITNFAYFTWSLPEKVYIREYTSGK